jgi:WD40 repeat protein
MLAAGGWADIQLWNLKEGGMPGTFENHKEWTRSVAFLDRKTLASGSRNGNVWLWDVSTGEPLIRPVNVSQREVTTVAFSQDGTALACGDDRSVRLWRIHRPEPLEKTIRKLKSQINVAAISSDCSSLATSDKDRTIRLWDLASGQEPVVVSRMAGSIKTICIDPQGRLLAAGGWDGTIRIWDLISTSGRLAAGGEPTTLRGHKNWISGLSFDPRGRLLAAAGADGTILQWDVERRQESVRFPETPRYTTSLCYSSDSQVLATGGSDGTIRLWDVSALKVQTVLEGRGSPLRALSMSPDDQILAAGSDDGTIRLWNRKTDKESLLTGHKAAVTRVVFRVEPEDRSGRTWLPSRVTNPGGPSDRLMLISGSDDGTIRLWDAATALPIGDALTGHDKEILGLMNCPERGKLVSVGNDGQVLSWDLDLASWKSRACATFLKAQWNNIPDFAPRLGEVCLEQRSGEP